ncbi:MAG: nicotinate-nucleotide adenylyltransferase [Defluviitaleaceae bacterium]|nr:nicotinate-nucleotide adenylyltransferase [Defluviitaleaceae bacterium]
MKKIGILGGTFDPPHFGHIRAAQWACDEYGLDEVIFLPTGNPVFKQGKDVTDAEMRYEMCLLATADYPNFSVSRMEIEREGATYTIDTMREFVTLMPDVQLYFIIGADAARSFDKWRDSDEILRLCTLSEVPRVDEDISSSQVREATGTLKSLTGLVAPNVADYIRRYGLYNKHLQGVAKEAVDLAKYYKVDAKKACTAGILHDCAKQLCMEMSFEEMREICADGGIVLDDFFAENKEIAHCYVGAVIAQEIHGIDDPEILSAIANHTFGSDDMNTMDKIVFLADFFEPNRPQNDVRKIARKLAYEDIDKAMDYVINYTIEKNVKEGRAIYAKGRQKGF